MTPLEYALSQPKAGAIDDEAGKQLAIWAGLVPDGGVIVEIGAFRGRTTCFLHAGARPGVAIYAVDLWDLGGQDPPGPQDSELRYDDPEIWWDWRETADGLPGGSGRVHPMRTSSKAAALALGRPVNLLVLDGNPSVRGLMDDIHAWWPMLAPNAHLVLRHDETENSPLTTITGELMALGVPFDPRPGLTSFRIMPNFHAWGMRWLKQA